MLINGLSAKVWKSLEQELNLVKLKRRQINSCEGSGPEYVYFPESCVISESKSLEDGRMLELSLIGREGAVGLVGLFFSEHHSAPTRQVVETGLAYRIAKADLQSLLSDDDRLRRELNPYVNTYVRSLSQQSVCTSFHNVRQRMSLRLMMIYERTASLMISSTHQELAHALGVFRPTLSILSQDLRDDGLIDYTRGKFQIEDPDRLRSEACEYYAQLWPAKSMAHHA